MNGKTTANSQTLTARFRTLIVNVCENYVLILSLVQHDKIWYEKVNISDGLFNVKSALDTEQLPLH